MEKIISVNLDANESIFFARELTHVKAKVYDVKYPRLKATQLIPVSTEASNADETIKYEVYDMVGVAKIIANYADDLPRVDVTGREVFSPIRGLGDSFGYSIQDVRAAQKAGKPLKQKKANAARKAVETLIDSIGWNGDVASGLPGFLTNENITRYVVDLNAGTTSTAWSAKTAVEKLHDMNQIANGIVVLTNEVEAPDTLLLPVDQFTEVATEPLSPTVPTVSILDYFLSKNPYIKRAEPLNKLASAGTLGTGNTTNIMVAYERNPDVLEMQIAQPFEMFPAQERGLGFEINCHARIGGTVVYLPLAIAIAEGI